MSPVKVPQGSGLSVGRAEDQELAAGGGEASPEGAEHLGVCRVSVCGREEGELVNDSARRTDPPYRCRSARIHHKRNSSKFDGLGGLPYHLVLKNRGGSNSLLHIPKQGPLRPSEILSNEWNIDAGVASHHRLGGLVDAHERRYLTLAGLAANDADSLGVAALSWLLAARVVPE